MVFELEYAVDGQIAGESDGFLFVGDGVDVSFILDVSKWRAKSW